VLIDANVIGDGHFDVVSQIPSFAQQAKLEFTSSVGPNQSVLDTGLLVIDEPKQFYGSVTLGSADSSSSSPLPSGSQTNINQPPEIDLIGLATADSYTFQNDMLSIFSGPKIIDTLRLHDGTANGFAVEKTSSSVNIVAITDPTNTPVGLPIHT
jgi:hypothetical protein